PLLVRVLKLARIGQSMTMNEIKESDPTTQFVGKNEISNGLRIKPKLSRARSKIQTYSAHKA
nr:hypothetical protein [Tanacetum cinerariifolium]